MSGSPSAIVAAGVPRGVGGLGEAAAAVAQAFTSFGFDTNYIGAPRVPRLAARAASTLGRRPVVRHGAERALHRYYTRRELDGHWDVLYAIPGLLPRYGTHRVLHQATHHPDVAAAAVRAERQQVGGGRSFMTAREQRLYARELNAADLIRTESKAVRLELIDRGVSPNRVVHAYPGVDLDRFVAGPPPIQARVAFIGPFALWKGAGVVAEVIRALPRDVAVGFVGGPVCSWSRRLFERLDFEQWSTPAELLRASTLMILPSATDGFGYVVLEALASGCVPVVTPAVGAAELLDELHPDLVQPRNAFPDAVRGLLESLPVPEMRGRARNLAVRFPRQRMASDAVTAVLTSLEASGGKS